MFGLKGYFFRTATGSKWMFISMSNFCILKYKLREGGLPYETDGDELGLNLTPKGDHLGMAQAFCDP